MKYLSDLAWIIAGLLWGVILPDFKINKVLLYVLASIITIGAVFLHFADVNEEAKAKAQTPIFAGIISPDSKKIPSDILLKIPPLEKNQTLILLGNRMAVISDTGHNSILSNGGLPILNVDINSDGLMTLSTTLSDSKNNKVVKIINNEFQAFPDFAFLPKQPDPHSLIVRDSDGVEVLNINYLNPQVIRLTGRFQLPGSPEPIVISDSEGIQGPGGGFIDYILRLEKAGAGAFSFTHNGEPYKETATSTGPKN